MSIQVAPFDDVATRDLDEILKTLRRGSETLNGQRFGDATIESARTILSSAIKRIGRLISATQTPVRDLAAVVMDALYGVLDEVDSVRRMLDHLKSDDDGIGSVDLHLSDAAVVIEELLDAAQVEHKRRNDC